MDPKKILGFAVYYFIALNISTLIVVQFSLDMRYAWMVYAGTIFIATLPCVYIVQGTTVFEIIAGISTALGGFSLFPIQAAAAAAGAAGAAGAAVGNPFAVGVGLPMAASSLAGALVATTEIGEVIGNPFGEEMSSLEKASLIPLPRSRSNSFEDGGRRKKRRGRGRPGNGFFAIPLY